MPTLHRSMRKGETIRIGDAVVSISPKSHSASVRLSITAPADVLIEHSSGDKAPLLPLGKKVTT